MPLSTASPIAPAHTSQVALMERDLEEQWKQRSDRQVAQAEERWKRKYTDLQDECQQLQTQLSTANTKVKEHFMPAAMHAPGKGAECSFEQYLFCDVAAGLFPGAQSHHAGQRMKLSTTVLTVHIYQ